MNKEKRKATTEYILKELKAFLTDGITADAYEEYFNKMTDTEFHNYMLKLSKGEEKITVIVPPDNPSNVSTTKNIDILEKRYKYSMWQRLIVKNQKDLPDEMTPIPYAIHYFPIRRAAQLLSKGISIPDSINKIDLSSGQVTGDSQSSKITLPEMNLLVGLGLEKTVKEAATIRGGDMGGLRALNGLLINQGRVSLQELEPYRTGVKSKETLNVYLKAMHIESTL